MAANEPSSPTSSMGVPGGGPDVPTGTINGEGDGYTDYAGSTDNQPRATPPEGSSTNAQPEWC